MANSFVWPTPGPMNHYHYTPGFWGFVGWLIHLFGGLLVGSPSMAVSLSLSGSLAILNSDSWAAAEFRPNLALKPL